MYHLVLCLVHVLISLTIAFRILFAVVNWFHWSFVKLSSGFIGLFHSLNGGGPFLFDLRTAENVSHGIPHHNPMQLGDDANLAKSLNVAL